MDNRSGVKCVPGWVELSRALLVSLFVLGVLWITNPTGFSADPPLDKIKVGAVKKGVLTICPHTTVRVEISSRYYSEERVSVNSDNATVKAQYRKGGVTLGDRRYIVVTSGDGPATATITAQTSHEKLSGKEAVGKTLKGDVASFSVKVLKLGEEGCPAPPSTKKTATGLHHVTPVPMIPPTMPPKAEPPKKTDGKPSGEKEKPEKENPEPYDPKGEEPDDGKTIGPEEEGLPLPEQVKKRQAEQEQKEKEKAEVERGLPLPEQVKRRQAEKEKQEKEKIDLDKGLPLPEQVKRRQQAQQAACLEAVETYKRDLRSRIETGWKPPKPPFKGEFTVLLEYRVNKNGLISDVRVAKSSGFALIDESAIEKLEGMQGKISPLPECLKEDYIVVAHTFRVIYR